MHPMAQSSLYLELCCKSYRTIVYSGGSFSCGYMKGTKWLYHLVPVYFLRSDFKFLHGTLYCFTHSQSLLISISPDNNKYGDMLELRLKKKSFFFAIKKLL